MNHRIGVLSCLVFFAACARPMAPAPTASPAPAPAAPVEPVPPAAQKASAQDTQRARELVAQGKALQRERGEGGAEDATKLYRQALESDRTCYEAYWELGWSLQILGRYDEALESWEHLRALRPDYPELELYYPVLKMRRDQAAALQALPPAGVLPAPEEEPRLGPQITINAVGDVQLGRAWPEERATLPPDDATGVFAAVADVLPRSDVTFGNLETALADTGESSKCGAKSTKCFAFRAPTAFAKGLAAVGFDVMSIANNHAGDFGEEGRQSTRQALDAAGVRHSGPIGDIASWQVRGLKVALVAFSTGQGVYRVQEIETGQRLVADLAQRHDLVVVSFHGGAEGTVATHVPKVEENFYGESRGNVYAFAHAMVDAGADLVLGHGPHVLRAMEVYKGRLIAYSLGNFSSWNTFDLRPPLGISTILSVTLAPNGVAMTATLHPVVLQKPGLPMPDPDRRAIRIVRELSQQDLGAPLFDAEGRYARPSQPAPVGSALRDGRRPPQGAATSRHDEPIMAHVATVR